MANHKKRSNDPIQKNTEGHLDPNILRSENMMQGFESNLAQDRVHHDEKTHSWNIQ